MQCDKGVENNPSTEERNIIIPKTGKRRAKIAGPVLVVICPKPLFVKRCLSYDKSTKAGALMLALYLKERRLNMYV